MNGRRFLFVNIYALPQHGEPVRDRATVVLKRELEASQLLLRAGRSFFFFFLCNSRSAEFCCIDSGASCGVLTETRPCGAAAVNCAVSPWSGWTTVRANSDRRRNAR